jgi:hypothetical protein
MKKARDALVEKAVSVDQTVQERIVERPVKKTARKSRLVAKKSCSGVTANQNTCAYCGFSYGDNDDPLLGDEWCRCSKCKKWVHESCSNNSNNLLYCYCCITPE